MRRLPAKATGLGISLVEAVVSIAVVVLLGAIVIPLIGKSFDDSRIARTYAEVRIIGQAIERFYRDLNNLPTKDTNYDEINSLISGTREFASSPYGFRREGSAQDWMSGGSDDVANDCDLMIYHLHANRPNNNVGKAYPTTGLHRWQGPYLRIVDYDPWGHPYVASLLAPTGRRVSDADGNVSFSRWVISAGPDGILNMPWHPTGDTGWRRTYLDLYGDDIGYRLDLNNNND